jgi:hypothetical protein
MPGCEHVLCEEHVGVCAIGGEAVCRACHADCAICSRPHCDHHTRTCVQCYREYCSECVRANGRCDTCAAVAKAGAPTDLTGEPWQAEPEVQKLLPHYTWRMLANERYTIYFGEGAMFNAAVIVVEHAPGPARVVHTRRISVVDRMRGLVGS